VSRYHTMNSDDNVWSWGCARCGVTLVELSSRVEEPLPLTFERVARPHTIAVTVLTVPHAPLCAGSEKRA
jgi:hypothetical protein